MFYLVIVSLANLIIVGKVNIFMDNYTQLSMDNYYLLVLYGILVSFSIYLSYRQISHDCWGKINLVLSLLSFITPYTKTNLLLNNIHLGFAFSSCCLASILTYKLVYQKQLIKLAKINFIIFIFSMMVSMLANKVIGLSELIISQLIITDLYWINKKSKS